MSNPQHVDADAVAASRDNLHTALDALTAAIKGHKDVDVIGPKTAHARAIASIREDVVRLGDKFDKDRLLRLGVVGQVKAGKSSLLNLLLFGGKEVLPKAATPMTASLTHITKSDRDEIEVEYYTKKDWAEIEEHAKEYKRMKEEGEDRTTQVPSFVQASHELVEMAAERGLQVGQHLDTTAVEAVPASEMNDRLTSLVGADGKLTPLVKSVTIRCAQGVPDLDIVDTPGINDPISSRSRRAEKMLVDCDAVLLLSYAGQFMEAPDVEFFERKLPQEGIRDRLIIGSKFDSALIDVAPDAQGDLQVARDDTKRRLESHASEAVRRLAEAAPEKHGRPKIIFASAMCSKLATTLYDQWDNHEKRIFDSLRKAYPDWLDPADELAGTITDETKETLTALGNEQKIDDYLDEQRDNKGQRIFASNQQKIEAKRTAALKEADELLESLRTYREKINNVNVEHVDQQIKKLDGLEQRLSYMIKDEWSICMEREYSEPLKAFQSELRSQADDALEKIGDSVEHRTKTRTKFVKGPWYKFGFGDREEEEEYEVRRLRVTAIENAVERVSAHIAHTLDELRLEMFTTAFVRESSKKLCEIVVNELENEVAADYDVDMLRASLRNALATVAASAREELEKAGNFQQTELTLSSKKVKKGLRKAKDAIRLTKNQAIGWINQVHQEWSQIAQQSEANLIPLAVAGLRESQEQLKKDIEDRAFKTSRIDSALHEIERCRTSLSAEADGTRE